GSGPAQAQTDRNSRRAALIARACSQCKCHYSYEVTGERLVPRERREDTRFDGLPPRISRRRCRGASKIQRSRLACVKNAPGIKRSSPDLEPPLPLLGITTPQVRSRRGAPVGSCS